MKEKIISLVVDRLKSRKISYGLISQPDEQPLNPENDLDIWIERGKLKHIDKIIAGIVNEIDDIIGIHTTCRLNGEAGREYFIYTNRASDRVHIDCWSYLYWRGFKIISSNQIGSNVVKDKPFNTLNSEMWALFTYLKDTLYTSRVRKGRHEIIRRIVSNSPSRVLNILGASHVSPVAHVIYTDIRSSQTTSYHVRRRIVGHLLLRSVSQPANATSSVAKFLLSKLRSWKPYSGRFVMMIGPDGSGKSTLSKRIIGSKRTGNFSASRYQHGRFGVLPTLSDIIPPFNGDRSLGLPSQEENGIGLSTTLDYFKIAYYTLDYALGHLITAYCRMNNLLLISDRYFYDYYIQPEYRHIEKKFLDALRFVIPKPDFVIRPKADASVIANRKPELTMEEIDRQNGELDGTLVFDDVVIISSDQDINRCIQIINALITDE